MSELDSTEVVFRYPVGSGIPLEAKEVVLDIPIESGTRELKAGKDVFGYPAESGIPLEPEETVLSIPVENGLSGPDGTNVVFGYPVESGIPLEPEEVMFSMPVETGIMLEPLPEEVIFGLKIESGAVGPIELLRFPDEVGKLRIPVTVTVPLRSIVITDVLLMLATMAVVKFTSVVVVTRAVVKTVDVTFAVIALPFVVVGVGGERIVPISG